MKGIVPKLVCLAGALMFVLQSCEKETDGGNGQKPDAVDLSEGGTANCYIVSGSGFYRFPAVKGNSSESAGNAVSAEVLWESFGTDAVPEEGDLVRNVSVSDGNVEIEVPEPYREGNAVVAVKDASGKILWSWHIWLTDIPEDQVYLNGAGTMMDRNLGAVSAVPGEPGALGLLYQWGRKDPFLGSSSVSEGIVSASTLDWPAPVASSQETGTMEYAVANPTTFINCSDGGNDWCIGGNGSGDLRWNSVKTVNDPCPAGYRLPQGGKDGIWSTALGSESEIRGTYDNVKKGHDFGSSSASSCRLTESPVCWYPSAGFINGSSVVLSVVGISGYCWSSTLDGDNALFFNFNVSGNVFLTNGSGPATGCSVRCMKEN